MEIAGGPVKVQSLRDLREEGHIVGLCGNLQPFMSLVPEWWKIISFTLGFNVPLELVGVLTKEYWLRTFKISCRKAEAYIMVGNIAGVSGASDDKGDAEKAGWRFIDETSFSNGVR